jgi:hypothetical protein
MSMSDDNSLNPQKVKMLIIETPDEFRKFIIKHNLTETDYEVTLSIIIDNGDPIAIKAELSEIGHKGI